MAKSDIMVRGEDVIVRATVDGSEVLSIDKILSMSGTVRIDNPESEFLGQVGVSVDMIIKGADGTIEFQFNDQSVFDFVQLLIDAAARRVAFPTINMQAQILFPDGSARVMLFTDCVFGNIPVAVPSRSSYAKLTLTWRSGQPPSFPVA